MGLGKTLKKGEHLMSTANITQELCWKLLDRHYIKIGEAGIKKMEKLQKKREHAGRVLCVCQRITAALSVSSQNRIDEERLAFAAILHDIAKFDNDEIHDKLALEIIQTEYAEWAARQEQPPADTPDFSEIGELIRWHKDDEFAPPAGLAPEASILRIADKIDQVHRKERKLRKADSKKEKEKLEKKLKKATDHYEESLELARAFWGNGYAAFKEICDKEKNSQ